MAKEQGMQSFVLKCLQLDPVTPPFPLLPKAESPQSQELKQSSILPLGDSCPSSYPTSSLQPILELFRPV